jgi:NADH-quinone oxidoreductase subunit M
MSHGVAVWLFIAFAIAFAVKAPIWPLHTWSPISYAEAPTAGSIEMSALLAKLGSYGLLRFTIGLLPLAFVTMRPIILTLAVIGILYGSALACVTPDLKRLVAYSSLAQMSFITLGLMAGSKIAMVGAVLLMFNHGVITIGFFLIIGFVETAPRFGDHQGPSGLQGPMPVMAALFTVVMLASIGLPGLSGFVSEYLILIGTFGTHAWWGVSVPSVWSPRRLPALGIPARLPRTRDRGQRRDQRRVDQGALGPSAGHRAHRRARRLSPPGARAHHALGPATD